MPKYQLSGRLADQECPGGQGQVTVIPSAWLVPSWHGWTGWIFKQVLLCEPRVLLLWLGKAIRGVLGMPTFPLV